MIDTVVEPFAGVGAYSMRAMWSAAGSRGDVRGEPPVSRMGNKAGFCANVFRAWDLNRVRWKAVWLNDASAVCHMFHLLYSSHELRVEVARRIWAMVPCPECLPMDVMWALKGELKPTPDYCSSQKEIEPSCPTCNGTGVQDARQLWERIRKEPIPGDVAQLADVTAKALFMQSRSFSLKPVEIVGGAWDSCSYKKEVDDLPRAPTSHAAGNDSPRWTVAGRVEALPGRWEEQGMSPEMREGRFTPDQGSRWTVAGRVEALPGRWVSGENEPCSGYKPEADDNIYACGKSAGQMLPRHEAASRVDSLPISHLSIRATWGDAALVLPVGDCSNVLCVLDPPYVGTSGYSADCPRETVLGLAREWHEAGALVLLHEACGLAGELGQGWLERDASGLRGKESTFWQKDKSKPNAKPKQREWLTFNREPVWWPGQQETMGDARVQMRVIKEAFKTPVMAGTPDLQGRLF